MASANGEMAFHDAANIFPLDDENITALADDIRKHGQQVEIEILDGKVIDGRRRWLACKMAGKKPATKIVRVDDPVSYVLSLNLHRRHLSPTQLAMVGAEARKLYDEQAAERKKRKSADSVVENLPQQKGSARDQVGKAIGVSGKSIDAATKVLRNAEPELVEAVKSDLVSVSTAARNSGFSREEQLALVERAKKSEKRPRPAAADVDDDEVGDETKRKGVGVLRANEAINCLIRIPKNDALRKRGFQIVTDWIRKNR